MRTDVYPIAAPGRQRGMTMITWLLVIVVALFIGTAVLRLVPIYLENFKIVSSMNSVKTEFMQTSPTIPAIRKALGARFDVESVRIVKIREVEITRKGKGYLVRTVYDHRSPFFSNVNLIVHFDTSVEIGT